MSCGDSDNEPAVQNADREFTFLNASIDFATKEESATLLGTSDSFTQELSSLDVSARLQDGTLTQESDYLQFAKDQALEWSEAEVIATKSTIAKALINIHTENLKLNLPSRIMLVKTSGKEEDGAPGYTRQNYIALGGIPDEELFLHELFHIYSRENPNKRDELYEIIGFKKCNLIKFPNSIIDQKITNSDAPIYEHFLTVNIDANPQDVVFVTYSERSYEEGSGTFFSYLKQKLMFVEGPESQKTVVLVNDFPILKDFFEASNIDELIGTNTNYNIHPEEISAEHFTRLFGEGGFSHQSLIDEMREILRR